MIIVDKSKLICPTCGSQMKPARSVNGAESNFWMKCSSPTCKTYIDTYVPLPHQDAIHRDNHRFTGVFGGYGSGKTQCSLKDDMKHMLSTPNGTTVVGSAVLAQVEQTYEKDFVNDFPSDFILSQNKTKKVYTLVNGHTLLIKSYYEENLLRSLTVSRAHIVEASEVDLGIFTQLKTRLRDTHGMIPKIDDNGVPEYDPISNTFIATADWRKLIIESNPSANWIRDDFLLKSDRLYLNDSDHIYVVDEPIKTYSSHVIPTKKNTYLPPTFYQDNAAGKPAWWVRRYLEGSFDYAEGLVYPSALLAFVEPFEIPDHWKRLIAWDYGIRDNTAIIFGAIDQTNGVLYIFYELVINNVNYETIAEKYKQIYPDLVPTGTLFRPAVMDGKSINKRNDFNLMTIGDMFASVGVYLEPAKMDLNARLLKVNTLIELGKLKIFSSCTVLRKEILQYKFPERTAEGKIKPGGDKPEDKNNHCINAMEFLCMEVPDDMKHIENNAYDEYGHLYSVSAMKFLENKNNKRVNPYDPFTPTKKKQNNSLMDDLFLSTGGINDIW